MALSNLTKVQTLGIGSNIEVVGVITTGQFKSGTSNLHSTGVDLTNLNVSGIATIGGNVSIGGTLTYQDVTNIDSVGLITARAGVNVSGGQLDVGSNIKLGSAGVATATTFVGNLTGNVNNTGNLLFQIGGSEKVRIDSSGRLLVATNSASAANSGADDLVVGNTSQGNNGISVVTNNANNAALFFADQDNTVRGGIRYQHGGDVSQFYAGGSIVLNLKNKGAGINETSPTADALVIRGGDTDDTPSLILKRATDGTQSAGEIIGKLQFTSNENNVDSGNYQPRVEIKGETTDTVGGAAMVLSTAAGSATSPTERLRITSTGLVGIATNSPSAALLDIATDQGSNDHLRLRRLSSDSNIATNWSLKPYAGNLYFRTGGSTDKIYFDDNGDINVMDGNLVIATAGHGIDFSATPNGYAGSISERLDDYEEGYWTPTVGGWSASGTGTYGTGGQKGRYTKIGNTVTVFFHIYWTALANASGVFAIESLPFPHASNQYYFSTAVQMRYVDYSGDTVFAIGGHDYSSSLLFYAQNDNGNHNYVAVDTNGGRIEGCVTYLTDS